MSCNVMQCHAMQVLTLRSDMVTGVWTQALDQTEPAARVYEGPARHYWYNTLTKLTSWDKPGVERENYVREGLLPAIHGYSTWWSSSSTSDAGSGTGAGAGTGLPSELQQDMIELQRSDEDEQEKRRKRDRDQERDRLRVMRSEGSEGGGGGEGDSNDDAIAPLVTPSPSSSPSSSGKARNESRRKVKVPVKSGKWNRLRMIRRPMPRPRGGESPSASVKGKANGSNGGDGDKMYDDDEDDDDDMDMDMDMDVGDYADVEAGHGAGQVEFVVGDDQCPYQKELGRLITALNCSEYMKTVITSRKEQLVGVIEHGGGQKDNFDSLIRRIIHHIRTTAAKYSGSSSRSSDRGGHGGSVESESKQQHDGCVASRLMWVLHRCVTSKKPSLSDQDEDIVGKEEAESRMALWQDRQSYFARLGACDMIVVMLGSLSADEDTILVGRCLKLGNALLEGGNSQVQRCFIEHLRRQNSELFFGHLHKRIQRNIDMVRCIPYKERATSYAVPY